MKLDQEFLQLPLRFDATRLAAEIAAFDESTWRPHPQGHPGNSALPLVAVDGDPGNDATRGAMRETPALARSPYLRQVFAAIGGVVGRSRLMRLDGNSEATPHADTNYYWIDHHRVHVPVQTTPDVTFHCGTRRLHMAAGECWLFDTWRPHNVLNPAGTRRIHLVIDTVGGEAFDAWMARARDPFGASASDAFAPVTVPFDPGRTASFPLESFNYPVVMSPWEIATYLARVDSEIAAPDADDDAIRALRASGEALHRAWRAAWAVHADDPRAAATYQPLLDRYARELAPLDGRLRLRNGVPAAEALRQFIVRAALNPALARVPTATASSTPAAASGHATTAGAAVSMPIPASPSHGPAGVAASGAPAIVAARGDAGDDPFAAPVFIVSPPRSGSSLLFETLAQSPDLATIGGESHAVIEGIASLSPRERQFDSNRLFARDATPDVVAALRQRFAVNLRDRDGTPAASSARALRLLEKTPKNALRVPFLAEAFPGAKFVYLYRDARETLSSMLDAWRSGRFVTYPNLPGWPAAPWSLLLTPGWREWIGQDLAEIVARQWHTTVRVLLDDLEALEPERWCVASYDRLVESPNEEIARLCAFLGLAWDRRLPVPLPNSRHTLTSPEPKKWLRNADALKPVLSLVATQANRAHQVFARPPATRPVAGRARHAAAVAARAAARTTAGAAPACPPPSPEPTMTAPPDAIATAPAAPAMPFNFSSVHTSTFESLLTQLGGSLAVTTYQSGRLILLRAHGGAVNTHLRAFASPMGLARRGAEFVLGTQRMVWWFRDQPAVAAQIEPAGRHDACFVPVRAHVTGDIRGHEMAFADGALWIVNTRFSCLSTLDDHHSFVPRWRPRFVSALAAEDRCHLNGLAVADDRLRYASALGTSDTAQGWRDDKGQGGCVIDIASGEIVTRGLCMPHSPRVHDGRLWILESGRGTLSTIDPATGRTDVVATLPGFTRGLAFAGPFAFVGLSQVRESVFDGVPVAQRETERHCGVWAVDTRSGAIVAFLRFEGDVREIFDVQFLAGLRHPDLLEPDDPRVGGSFVLPDAAMREVVR